MQKGFAQILQAPAFRDELIRSGSLVGGNSPEEFAAFWRADRARLIFGPSVELACLMAAASK